MSLGSAIEWTDATWNPVTGCTRVSPGCAHCYIERTPPFRMAGRRFEVVGQESATGVQLHPERLEQPLRWRTPRRVFVNSLSDLFHEDVPIEFIAEVFDIMSCATLECRHRRWADHEDECWTGPSHVFQVLTKRPERAREALEELPHFAARCMRGDRPLCVAMEVGAWPLENVWLGVSIENTRYTWRADVLREIPAAVRFVSAEPLLDSLFDSAREHGMQGDPATAPSPATPGSRNTRAPLDLAGIDWVIVGGESGPGARPLDLSHARELVTACMDGRDPEGRPRVFVKQLGSVWARQHTKRGLDCGPADAKGGDWSHWPPDLRIREFPERRASEREDVQATARAAV